MTILITGGCKNGKSSLAQDLACKLASERRGRLIYFATMIPHDSEDDERIQKHRKDRKNLGFATVECGKNIAEAARHLESNGVVLFDSLTALVANELFENDAAQNQNSVSPNSVQNLYEVLSSHESEITQKVQSELEILMNRAESVIFVTDTLFDDGKIYDETTELYRRILAKTAQFVASRCDKVIEMTAGKRKTENGKRKNENGKMKMENDHNFHLIIGGAYQGKTDWAKSEFSLSDGDICVCTEDELPDFSKKCLAHYENYVAFCLKTGEIPKTDFSDTKVEIVICDDIFCGVVPIDSFQRKWREETGLALQKIAKRANLTRIFCGIAQRL